MAKMVRPAGVCIGSLFLLLLSMFAIMQFFALGCREKNLIFHAAMVNQVVFAAYQVVKHAVEHIVVFQLIVSDHDVFELGETLGHVGVVAAIFLQTEISQVFTGYEPLYIWKDVVVFKLHVFADLFHIIVVIFDYEECHVGDFCAIDGFYELLADLRQVEVEEIFMGFAEISHQRRERNLMVGKLVVGNEIGDLEKGVDVDAVFAAYFADSGVAESEWNGETADHEDHKIVVFDHIAQPVAWKI